MTLFYLDTSAAVKLVVAERGSTALRRWLEQNEDQIVSSDLLRTELLRTTRRVAPDHVVLARAVLEAVVLLKLSTAVCERAAIPERRSMRSLDALHLAAAMELGDDLGGIVTYDARMTEAALGMGITAIAPR